MTPFEQGFAAYAVRGTGRDICPYETNSEEAAQWRTGWWAACIHMHDVLAAIVPDEPREDEREESLAEAWLRRGRPL
jgi:ribosome modulation factor